MLLQRHAMLQLQEPPIAAHRTEGLQKQGTNQQQLQDMCIPGPRPSNPAKTDTTQEHSTLTKGMQVPHLQKPNTFAPWVTKGLALRAQLWPPNSLTTTQQH